MALVSLIATPIATSVRVPIVSVLVLVLVLVLVPVAPLVVTSGVTLCCCPTTLNVFISNKIYQREERKREEKRVV